MRENRGDVSIAIEGIKLDETGLLRSLLKLAKPRAGFVSAWIDENFLGIANVHVNDYVPTAKSEYVCQLELSLDFSQAPTGWLIAQDSSIALKWSSSRKSATHKHQKLADWKPGRIESEFLLRKGLKRVAEEGLLDDIPGFAARRGQVGFLRDVLVRLLGSSLDRFIAIQDQVLYECISFALSVAPKLKGIDRLVVQRSAYSCLLLASLTGKGLNETSLVADLAGLADRYDCDNICLCLRESLHTRQLTCEKALWKNRLDYMSGALAFRLYRYVVGESTFRANLSEQFSPPNGTLGSDAVAILKAIVDYIYYVYPNPYESLLLRRLIDLTMCQDSGSGQIYSSELDILGLHHANNRYLEQSLTIINIVHGCRNLEKLPSLTTQYIVQRLEECLLVLSSYDFSSHFAAFKSTALRFIRTQLGRNDHANAKRLLQNAIKNYFVKSRHICKNLAHSHGNVSTAIDYQSTCLESLEEVNTALFCLDCPPTTLSIIQRADRKRWLIIGSRDLNQCWIYRVIQKKEYLEMLGNEVRIIGSGIYGDDYDTWSRHVLWADAIICCRLPYILSISRLYSFAKVMNVPIYYEIDDLIFSREHFPPPLSTYSHTIVEDLHSGLAIDTALFSKALELSNYCIVSTSKLRDYVVDSGLQKQENVIVIPNLMLPALRAIPQQTAASGSIFEPKKRKVKIVFSSGTLAHKEEWRNVLGPALAAILSRHENVDLTLLGSIPMLSCLIPYQARIIAKSYQDYPQYLADLQTADIGVSVLESNPSTDCKSMIKWMEYSMCGLASVVSPTQTYLAELAVGHDVYFATSLGEWISRLESLVLDPRSRRRLRDHARGSALRYFGIEQGLRLYAGLSGQSSGLTIKNSLRCSRRKKILIVNVFFRPNSVGGATRVAEQQAYSLLKDANHKYEITILCQETPGSTEERGSYSCEYIDGLRVVRAKFATIKWSEIWDNKTSPLLLRSLEDWYRREQFDLVHAHCLQVLTIAPLIAAAKCAIPYIVTLHDAWWLSPSQFLTTEDGKVLDPKNPFAHLPRFTSRTAKRSAQRRRDQLLSILQGAHARIAVSETFAALYQQAGVEDVDVLRNRYTSMRYSEVKKRRSQSESGSIKGCFIGGISAHKGFYVLRDSLLECNVEGFELSVIDHAIDYASCATDTIRWGTTPVAFLPPVPMHEMASFYQDYDILIAPSIWPESFGLVVREALSAGLWVIASDVGALAEDIIPSSNGFVVKAGDSSELAAKIKASVKILNSSKPEHDTPQETRQAAAGCTDSKELQPEADRDHYYAAFIASVFRELEQGEHVVPPVAALGDRSHMVP
jgi:glycosyltransferase involved in cell wall biosynthesis